MALVKRDNQFSVATIQESTKEQNRTNVKVLDEETYVQVGHLQSYYDLFEELNRISESLFCIRPDLLCMAKCLCMFLI